MPDVLGWIKLHRKLIYNELITKPFHLQLFIYLLLIVNHKPGKKYGKDINRGQTLTGRKELARALKQKEMSIYRRLKWLENRTMIEQQSDNKATILTIVNYDGYQVKESSIEQQQLRDRTSIEQQQNTNKNGKKGKKKEIKDIWPNIDVEIPDYIPTDLWSDFMQMRVEAKARNTERAVKLILKDIEKFKEVGHNPINLIENSIKNNWKSVYEPKKKPINGLPPKDSSFWNTVFWYGEGKDGGFEGSYEKIIKNHPDEKDQIKMLCLKQWRKLQSGQKGLF